MHPLWDQSIIITFPFDLGAVTPQRTSRHPPFLLRDAAHTFWGGKTEHCLASCWALLDQQLGSFNSVYLAEFVHFWWKTSMKQLQVSDHSWWGNPSPELLTFPHGLRGYIALFWKKMNIYWICSQIWIFPSNQPLAWLFKQFKHQRYRLCISSQAVRKWRDSLSWQPSALAQDSWHQEVSYQTITDLPRCWWPHRTTAKGQWELPN